MTDTLVGVRTRACKVCGNSFSYEVRRGTDRLYCSRACLSRAASDRWKSRPRPPCSVEGCGKVAANLSCGYCDAHYARLRRTGRLELSVPAQIVDHSHGYKLLYAPGHPLSPASMQSRIYEHRAVYYATHGEGPFNCYHCGVEVTWSDMHVDHLNDQRDDNSVANLAASCPACNQQRGRWKMKRTLRARQSHHITWNGRTQSLPEWAEEIGISRQAFKNRLSAGWPIDRVMTEPRGRSGPKGSG